MAWYPLAGDNLEERKAILCFHLLASSLLSRHSGEENFKLFWPLCLAVEAVCYVRDALAMRGEGAGGVSPRVSLFFISLEVPQFHGDRGGDLLWPPQLGWLCRGYCLFWV